MILAAVGLFSLGNSSDLFLILRSQNLGMRAWTAPALGLLFNTIYAALSWPAGKLSDRLPRRWLIVAGYTIYAAVYAGFAWLRAPELVWFLFAIYGTYYALTEGVMKAWIADLAPSRFPGLGLWRAQLGGGRCRVPASLWPGGSGSVTRPPRRLPFPAFSLLVPPGSCSLRKGTSEEPQSSE